MNNSAFKQLIYNTCLDLLALKITECNSALHDLASGIENDAKSSAGDKHETARAMMQQEQEKLGWQLKEITSQLESLEKISINIPALKVNTGSLVKTDKGYLFLCIAIGRLTIAGEPVIVLSPQSPLGTNLTGKSVGDIAEMNGSIYRIQEIL